MKKFLLIIFLLSILFITCKEDEPTAPEEETPTGEVLAEATIGPEGGTIETEEFKVEIPTGAFDNISNIKILENTNQTELDNTSISKKYLIEGLPINYKVPIPISIAADLSGEADKYIAVGEKVFVPSLNTEKVCYHFFEAEEKENSLKFSLPVPQSESQFAKRNDFEYPAIEINAQGIGVKHISSNNHFYIFYAPFPVSGEALNSTIKLGDYLEEAYEKFQAMGFEYSNRTSWPMRVSVRPLEDKVYGMYSNSMLGNNFGKIHFNSDKISELDELRLTAGHEFFHFVQSLYDNRFAYSKARSKDYLHYWLDEATAVWSESLFSDDPNYTSKIVGGYQLAPFNGIQKGAENNGQNHGYGMLSLIKYLVKNNGTNWLVNTYDKIYKGKHPIKAISESVGDPIAWYEKYLRDYLTLQLNIFDVSGGYWRQNMHDALKINSKTDMTKTFTSDYPDLSARLYKIELNSSEITDQARLSFSLNEGGVDDISLFKYRIGYVHFIESVTDEITLKKLRTNYINDGWNLFALVTNSLHLHPYTESNEITLTVNFSEPEEVEKNYKTAYIDVHVKGFHIRTTDDGSYEDPYYEFYETYSPGGQNGNLSGTTFTASWSDSREENFPEAGTMVTWNGSINIIFSEDFQEIISYTETNAENWPGWRTTNMSVSVKNIPFNYGDEWSGDEYYLSMGEETCNYVVSRSYNTIWHDGKSFVFSRNECDEESYIKITLFE